MIFIAIIEYAILASTFTLSKVAIGFADPLFLIGIRMLIAAPLIMIIQALQQKKFCFNIEKKDYYSFFKVGIYHIAIPFIGEFWALQYISSIKSAITYSLTPFIAAFLSFLLLKKKLSLKQSFGLFIGLFGILPIFISSSPLEQLMGEFLYISLPEIILLFSVISASYAWFIISDLMNKGYSISLINAVSMFIGGCISLLIWLFTTTDFAPLKGNFQDFIFWTLCLVVVANVISYNLYGWLLKHISITLMSVTGFFCPIFASLYGWLFLQEEVGILHVISLFMVIVALWLFYQDEISFKDKNYLWKKYLKKI